MKQEVINGIAHEVHFWSWFVETERFKENWLNPTGNPELEQEVKDLIAPYLPGAKVLDVGSGPVSILRGFASVVTADPLAEFYKSLVDFKAHGIQPPVAVTGEEVGSKFEKNSFDICHIRNALDHSQDPGLVIESMMNLLKPGGIFIAHGFTKEADFEKWEGLHQWNIEKAQKGITITGSDGKSREYRGTSWIKKLDSEKEWFFFTKKKEK